MQSKYLVIQSCGANDHPKYNGVSFVKPCETIEQAKSIASEWVKGLSIFLEHELKEGDSLDEELLPTDDIPSHYYSESGLSAWIRGNDPDWERIEVFEWRPEGYVRVI